MALPNNYDGQRCSLARTLEIVGERWTLLIVRDAFYGARRFGEFVDHLDISRAVLTDRLNALVAAGVLKHNGQTGKGRTYELTDKGLDLWPTVRAMITWGDRYYAPGGPRRVFRHAADAALIGADGRCTACGAEVAVADIVVTAGQRFATEPLDRDDIMSAQLRDGHPMLTPFSS